MILAVIGIGSNSVRMLTAEAEGGDFRRMARDRAGTRLFAGLDEQGNLSAESMARTLEAMSQMAQEARRRRAERLHAFATSAARDARNGKEFMAAAEQATGVPLEILSGEEEAELSFLGARDVFPDGRRCGVIDIGGGSTEIVTGEGQGTDCAFSCQMGAVRLFRAIPLTCRADMTAVEADGIPESRHLGRHRRNIHHAGRHGEKHPLAKPGGHARDPGDRAGDPPDRGKPGRHESGRTETAARPAARTGGHCGARYLHPAGGDEPAGGGGHHRERIRKSGRIYPKTLQLKENELQRKEET